MAELLVLSAVLAALLFALELVEREERLLADVPLRVSLVVLPLLVELAFEREELVLVPLGPTARLEPLTYVILLVTLLPAKKNPLVGGHK